MNSNKYQFIFTQNIARLILFANSLGVNLTFGEANRTFDQQELYFYGKTVHADDDNLILLNDKIRTRTLDSNHLYQLAVDFNFFIRGKLFYKHPLINRIGEHWESLNPANRWGGNFKSFYDSPHFEMHIKR